MSDEEIDGMIKHATRPHPTTLCSGRAYITVSLYQYRYISGHITKLSGTVDAARLFLALSRVMSWSDHHDGIIIMASYLFWSNLSRCQIMQHDSVWSTEWSVWDILMYSMMNVVAEFNWLMAFLAWPVQSMGMDDFSCHAAFIVIIAT